MSGFFPALSSNLVVYCTDVWVHVLWRVVPPQTRHTVSTHCTRGISPAAHLLDEEDTEEDDDDEGAGSRHKGGAKGRPKKKDSYAKEKGDIP